MSDAESARLRFRCCRHNRPGDLNHHAAPTPDGLAFVEFKLYEEWQFASLQDRALPSPRHLAPRPLTPLHRPPRGGQRCGLIERHAINPRIVARHHAELLP